MASIFTMIINGEIPSYKVAEDENYYAFLDINPMQKGHTLVVPKREEDYLFDLTDEEYRQRLEAQTEQIDNAILEACRTKRRNLFRTGPVAARIGQQFAIRRLTDWERSGPYIAEGYVGERIEQLIADGRLITAQTRYGQGLRTATEAELEMAENADPMQMHF